MASARPDIVPLDFAVDRHLADKPKLGLVVLATDYTIEAEIGAVLSASGLEMHAARIAMDPEVTPGTLASMGPRITDTARLILPSDRLDVVAYGCTSASVVLGEDTVASAIHAVHPDAKTTTPITAALAAFRTLAARRIAVLTPYTDDVNARLRAHIEARGHEVPVFGSFHEPMDPVVATIDTSSIRAAIKTLVDGRDIDMVFVSCTSLRFLDAVADAEREIGLPITTSNHAMAWHMCHLAGLTPPPDYGRLYARSPISA